jgi:transposase
MADEDHDADKLVQRSDQRGAQAVIAPRSDRRQSPKLHNGRFKSRNREERFVNGIKYYRPIATRHEKTARNYLALVHPGRSS